MIRRGYVVCLFLFLSYQGYGQNFGNASYLKYGFTENELQTDIHVNGFTLTNSPSKAFLLRQYNSNAFAVGSTYKPIDFNVNGESSGESIQLGHVNMPTKFSVGYRHISRRQDQVHTTWNSVVFKKKETMKFRVSGHVFVGNQEFQDDCDGFNWSRNENTLNGYVSISNFNHSAKNRISFQAMTIMNRAESDALPRYLHLRKNRYDGNLHLGKFTWSRKLSANHNVNATVSAEQFLQQGSMIFWQGQTFLKSETDYTQLRLTVTDVIMLKKKKVENSLVITNNQIDWNVGGIQRDNRYQLAVLNSSLTHYFKSNVFGVRYDQSAGIHSRDGGVFNPGIKFFHKLQGLKYDVGFIQKSRTPSLSSDFITFTTVTPDSNDYNISQEQYRKWYTSAKFEVSRLFNMEFKYVLTESPNKWLFHPVSKMLGQNAFRYSSIYAKISQYQYNRTRYQFVYRYIIPETKTAEILADHFIHGKIDYRLHRRSMRLFNKYRTFDFSCDLNAIYLSNHHLPFMDGEVQASHDGGFFADAHLKLKVSRTDRYYYYDRDYDKKRIQNVVLQLGVTNMLNTRSTLQPLTGNHFKPILPRQISTSLIIEI